MTLLGVRAKNHPQQVGRRGADDTTDDRRTPDELWLPWHERFRFTVDAAATAENTKLAAFYPDAFAVDWTGRVWCNPPYSDLHAWVAKAFYELTKVRDDAPPEVIVMLVPANRTEQRWWQNVVEPYRDQLAASVSFSLRVEFLRGRMRFNRPGWTKPTKGDRPPFGLCLLIWERA